MGAKITIIIPCYFNELNLPETTRVLIQNESLFDSNTQFEYILIDDASEDGTWQAIRGFKNTYPEKVIGLRLKENVGSYNAIYPGIARASGDCLVVMAADLQDPPSHIKKMFEKWKNGSELVVANRLNVSIGIKMYYGLLRILGLKKLPNGGFDYCLFSASLGRKMLQFQPQGANSLYQLLELTENHDCAPYVKEKRMVGTSRWTTSKKTALAICTIFRYSKLDLSWVVALSSVALSAVWFLCYPSMRPICLVFLGIAFLTIVTIKLVQHKFCRTVKDLSQVISEVI